MSYHSTCACAAGKVQARCTDVKVVILVLGDENGAALTDDFNVAISVGAERRGDPNEFEFNRQLPPTPPTP